MSNQNKYSTEIRLREEAEAPFRKVRTFVYSSLIAGAFLSLAVSAARIAAGLAGINADLLQESYTNAAVDIGGIVLLGFLLKFDYDAEQSRLARASKGAALASLVIRSKASLLNPSLVDTNYDDSNNNGNNVISAKLSSLRSGRGIDKRVVITAASQETLEQIMTNVAQSPSLQESLTLNDLLIVPVALPQCNAPLGIDLQSFTEDCVALPNGGASWMTVVSEEAKEAESQGVDTMKNGMCIILKKNGRVGQRTAGIDLGRMVGEVQERQEAGMDVKNI